jgi:hypothetical protein
MTVIIASALCVIAFNVLLALALSRASARADRACEHELAELHATAPIRAYRLTYAGFVRGRTPRARGSSLIVPASRTSVSTRRAPVGSAEQPHPRG